jgi:site-specific DNA recombinase
LLKKIDFVEYTDKIEDKIADLELQCGGLQKQILDDGKRIQVIKEEIPTLQQKYVNAKSLYLSDAVQEQLLKNESEIKQIDSRIEKNTNKIARLKDQIKNIKAFAKSEDFNNLNLAERASLFKKYIKRIQYLPVTIMQGFYDIEFKFGVSEKVAVKKTNRSPVFAIVPQAFEITDELKLRVTTYDPALAKEIFDFGATTNQEITIQEFFEKFANDYLTVDLSYRDQ